MNRSDSFDWFKVPLICPRYFFVHYVQKSISEYLNSINYYVTVMHEFCDGCQCQYKSWNCFGDPLIGLKFLLFARGISSTYLKSLLLQACDRLVFRLFSANSKSFRADLISALLSEYLNSINYCVSHARILRRLPVPI
jgi:hypothetical protein